MFHGLAVGWADLVLPATSSLERDGTLLNLEGRLQRLRRAVIAPVPDELAWIAKLAGRFEVDLSPHAVVVFDELSALVFGGVDGSELNATAVLPPRTPYDAPAAAPGTKTPIQPRPAGDHFLGELRLVRYRPLFSGPFVERVDELAFQRPPAELELSAADAAKRTIVLRRHRRRAVERHLDRAEGPRQPKARRGDGPRARRARGRPAPAGGGREAVNVPTSCSRPARTASRGGSPRSRP